MKGIPRYPLNQRLRSTATFRAAPAEGSPVGTLGDPADPGTVEFALLAPDGTETRFNYPSAELTKISTGVYQCDFSLDQPGDHYYAWFGTGEVQTTYERHIFGVRQRVAA